MEDDIKETDDQVGREEVEDKDPIIEIFDVLDAYEFYLEDYIDILEGLCERMGEVAEEDSAEAKEGQKALANELEILLERYKGTGE